MNGVEAKVHDREYREKVYDKAVVTTARDALKLSELAIQDSRLFYARFIKNII